MKLLLVIVTTIAVWYVDCRDFSDEHDVHDTTNKIWPFPKETEGQDESQNFLYETDGSNLAENHDSDYNDNQLKEEGKEHNQRQHRRSKCKARNACVVMGGFCVTNVTLCRGRMVPDGCKGTNCQCCIPGTIEAKFDSLEKEIQSLKANMNSSNSKLNLEMQSLKNNMNSGNSNINTKVDLLTVNEADCPKGFFNVPATVIQCFKYFNDSGRSWHSAKSKCQQEGLVLAKPLDPLALRRFILNPFDNYIWVGGQGTGSYVKWDIDGITIGSDNPMWRSGQPGSKTSSSDCLVLAGKDTQMNDHPTTPYYMGTCSDTHRFGLCELLME